MGSAASAYKAKEEEHGFKNLEDLEEVKEFVREEVKRPSDANDLTSHEAAKAEVTRYRTLIRELSVKLDLTDSSQQIFRHSRAENLVSDDDGTLIQVNQYRLSKVLGVGSFGVVVSARDMSLGKNFAMKVIDRHRMNRGLLGRKESALDEVKREIAIQKQLKHQNILPLVEVIDAPGHPKTYLVMELVEGGALMPDVSMSDPLPLDRARVIFWQLASALQYLHAHNVVHKDIKPSNLLVTDQNHLYLSDFGASQMFAEDELPLISSTDGTMAFFAPEMCYGENQFDGKKADIWALGASLFMLVHGHPPFVADSPDALVEKIARGVIEYPSSSEKEEVNDLLRKILVKDADKRPSLAEIASHSWCTSGLNKLLPKWEDHEIPVS